MLYLRDRVLKLNLPEVRFDLSLRYGITVIDGESSTGKSLLVNKVRKCLSADALSGSSYVDSNREIVCIDYTNFKEISIDGVNKFFIIDNADIVMSEEYISAIRNTVPDNLFLILGRGSYGLGLSPNYFGEFYDDNGVIRIRYDFNAKGWF